MMMMIIIIIMMMMMIMMMIMIMIIIMSVFLERLSMRNMLNCAEQLQIQKYKTLAQKTLKTGVQTIMLKHPTKQLKKITHKTQIPYQRTHK